MPRRANNNPKTIEQIHKDAQEEEQKKQADMQKSVMERGRRGGGAGAGGRELFQLITFSNIFLPNNAQSYYLVVCTHSCNQLHYNKLRGC